MPGGGAGAGGDHTDHSGTYTKRDKCCSDRKDSNRLCAGEGPEAVGHAGGGTGAGGDRLGGEELGTEEPAREGVAF